MQISGGVFWSLADSDSLSITPYDVNLLKSSTFWTTPKKIEYSFSFQFTFACLIKQKIIIFHSYLVKNGWEVMSKTRASCFIRGSKHPETIKALRLGRSASICYSVFVAPDNTLTLVFDIWRKTRFWKSQFPFCAWYGGALNQ